MRVVVVASRKGGSGKTVMCRHLAVEAMRSGISRVALVDLDPMRGLTKWWQRRPGDAIELIDLGPNAADALADGVRSLRAQGFGLAIIDTAPSADDSVKKASKVADLIVTPVRASPDDLDAVGETIDLVERAGKPLVFVINSATRKARLTGDAAIVLSQHGKVSPSIIHRSDAFAASAISGLTVQEADARGTPAAEIAALWVFVAKQLGIEFVGKSAIERVSLLTSKQAIRAVK